MKIASPSVVWLFWLSLPLIAACYARTDGAGAADSSNVVPTTAGGAAPSAAASSGTRTPPGTPSPASDGSGGRGAGAPAKPPGTPRPVPANGGSGGCGAIRGPGESVSADTSAFTGVGGAGFNLVGICDRCGWSHETDACRSLVYSVPTGGKPEYYPCLDISLEWVGCLETMSCICSGDVPKPCRDVKSNLDACIQGDFTTAD